MWPALAAIASAVIGAVSSKQNVDSTNSAQAALADRNNKTEIELANTAHQREVKDLVAAGLNPILSAKLGGASTPSLTTPQLQSAASQISSSAHDASYASLNYQNLRADLDVKKSQILANSAQAAKTGAEARSAAYQADVDEMSSGINKWKLRERSKSRGWELMLEDAKRGLDVINPLHNWGR